jgi:hypothetical protein
MEDFPCRRPLVAILQSRASLHSRTAAWDPPYSAPPMPRRRHLKSPLGNLSSASNSRAIATSSLRAAVAGGASLLLIRAAVAGPSSLHSPWRHRPDRGFFLRSPRRHRPDRGFFFRSPHLHHPDRGFLLHSQRRCHRLLHPPIPAEGGRRLVIVAVAGRRSLLLGRTPIQELVQLLKFSNFIFV